MSYLSRFSPVRAYRDLRFFLASRQPHELWFLIAAMAITGFLIFAFMKDSRVEPEYRPNIVYVEQWSAARTDAQIRAQQAIDGPIEAKAKADQKAREEAARESYKKLDEKMTAWGL